jgi:hypothetical protein
MISRVFKFEGKHHPVLPRREFIKRLARNFGVSVGLIGMSLVAGMLGYHRLEGMPWIDAFANASMILSGMGPLAPLNTWGGKMFAGWYALYSGLVVVIVAGIILSPIIHRVMHRFHAAEDKK